MKRAPNGIPQVMLWELLNKEGWYPILGIVFNIAIPLLLFLMLRGVGIVDPLEPTWISMHIYFLQMALFCVAYSFDATPDSVRRLFPFPISIRQLVVFRVVPVMIVNAIAALLLSSVMNALFELQWPLLSSMLFAITVSAVGQAANWQSTNQLWRLAAMIVCAIAIGLWHRTRYGSLRNPPTHMWQQVTALEMFTMISIVVASYFFAVHGLARCRCGESLLDFGIAAKVRRWFDRADKTRVRFISIEQAQTWYFSHLKGWVLPSLVSVVGGLFLIGSLFNSTSLDEYSVEVMAGGFALIMAGFVSGVIWGICDPETNSSSLRQFLATQPVSVEAISRAILVSAFKSLGMAWSLWASVFSVIAAALYFHHLDPWEAIPKQLGWWYFPMTFLGPWVSMTSLSALLLTGREKWVVSVTIVFFALVIGLAVFEACFQNQSPTPLEQHFEVILIALSAAMAIGSVATFTIAYRHSIIGTKSIRLAFVLWLLLSSIVAIEWGLIPNKPSSVYCFAFGFLAWVVWPIASVPLALRYNRVR